MSFVETAKEYLIEDITAGIDSLNNSENTNVELLNVDYETATEETVIAIVTLKMNGVKFDVKIEYFNSNGDAFVTMYDGTGNATEFYSNEFDKFIQSEYEKHNVSSATRIVGADEDEESIDEEFDFDSMVEDDSTMIDEVPVDDTDTIQDTIDDVTDALEDLQDSVDDIEPDLVDIQMNNNIEDHYIAECEACHGVFISAVVKSEIEIEHVHGVCPICDREADQKLKWLIVAAASSNNV